MKMKYSTNQKLIAHRNDLQNTTISQLFAECPRSKHLNRFEQFSQEFVAKDTGILFDYSKNLITSTTKKLLLELAKEANVEQWRDKMFSGDKINHTENRAVLHTALRAPITDAILADGVNVVPKVHQILAKMEQLVNKVHSQQWFGYSGKAITDIVNIGIGGSDLGPQMVVKALHQFHCSQLRTHFISNLDGQELESKLALLNPETTLFLVASKTFTTLETIANAKSAKQWLLSKFPEQAVTNHFIAISTNLEETSKFGITPENVFEFWDWVGGRYSLWSAIGLSIALAIGMDKFRELLAGAYAMDQHFQQAPLAGNLPVLMALIGVWNHNYLVVDACSSKSNRNAVESHAVLTYASALDLFPVYLQQLDMESNGKHVNRSGESISYPTSPIVWGGSGSNGQHSFFQFLHQSPIMVSIDFIGTIKPTHNLSEHHDLLTANMFAQAELLMQGRNLTATLESLSNLPSAEAAKIAPYKTFAGNRASNTILLDELTPHTLGSLIALYEHKMFVQGVIWDLNSFDQMGVELGKTGAKQIYTEFAQGKIDVKHDISTQHLMEIYLNASRI